jgi:FtsP/CotA-like multicopper oxidase with cupredoxin domain
MNRRRFLEMGGVAAASGLIARQGLATADYAIEIAPLTLEIAPKHSVKTMAYNGQIPGPLLRFKEGESVTIDVTNRTGSEEIVHWHGLFLPPEVDGAMEEGTPMIAPGGHARYMFTPSPSGFRWYHTHTFAGQDLKKGQYSGLHGFLMIDPREPEPIRYDQEVFLALHDWDGEMAGSSDGSMNPEYRFSTINGKVLGFGEPLRVKQGQRVLMHVVNVSATEQHWIALAGHQFQVVALDGNRVPSPRAVSMLRLAPAERVCAVVEMNNPGVWVLGEVRKHIQAAGMGAVVEYAGQAGKQAGKPVWQQPESLVWNYAQFAAASAAASALADVVEIPLIFESRFAGHGAPDHWMINGKSWPHTESVALKQGQRYRLHFQNPSHDDHPVHLHRHSFELRSLPGAADIRGIMKDVVLVESKSEVEVEFVADHPGTTLFHCHQQNHMDEGFMLVFHYA